MSLGQPSVRTVLLKDFNSEGFTFFTNYESRKASEIDFNQNVGICFFWKELERQVIITGYASKISKEASEKYFKKSSDRPSNQRLGFNSEQ